VWKWKGGRGDGGKGGKGREGGVSLEAVEAVLEDGDEVTVLEGRGHPLLVVELLVDPLLLWRRQRGEMGKPSPRTQRRDRMALSWDRLDLLTPCSRGGTVGTEPTGGVGMAAFGGNPRV